MYDLKILNGKRIILLLLYHFILMLKTLKYIKNIRIIVVLKS